MHRFDATNDDALVRFIDGPGLAIDVSIKHSPKPVMIGDLPQQAVLQLGTVHPSANIIDQQVMRVGDRPAAVIYFMIPDPDRGWWVMGQGFVQIDDRAFVMLKLEAFQHHWPAGREIFDRAVHSVTFRDAAELAVQRREAIEAGRLWREQTGKRWAVDDLAQAQLHRILERGQDVGYLKLSARTDRVMGLEGLRVDVQTRVVSGAMAQDTLTHAFVSYDDSYEVWSVISTVRPANPEALTNTRHDGLAGPADGSYSWAETGVRSVDRITVSREGPAGIKEYHWQRPPVGYLSQAEVLLLDRMLATHMPASPVGFYIYHPGKKKIVFRHDEVSPQPDGGAVVTTRPSPDMAEETASFDPQGRLQRVDLPNGRRLVPATPSELASRWQLR